MGTMPSIMATNSAVKDTMSYRIFPHIRKKNKLKKADEYLTQSLKFQDEDRIKLVIFETLKQYIYTFKNKKILDNKKNFGILSLIAETFQRCYVDD